jgi:two-component system KDP operon response regulator KdpE
MAIRKAPHVVRHLAVSTDRFYLAPGIEIDFFTGRFRLGAKIGHLTPKEGALLRCLISRDGRVVPHKELLAVAWGARSFNRSNYLHVFMTNLRKKIESDPSQPQYIETVPCVGYRFSVPADDEETFR